MRRYWHCARRVQQLVTIAWETANCLLQLSRAQCARARSYRPADHPKAGAVHSAIQVLNHLALNHHIEVRSGVLAGRCAEMVQAFFKNRR